MWHGGDARAGEGEGPDRELPPQLKAVGISPAGKGPGASQGIYIPPPQLEDLGWLLVPLGCGGHGTGPQVSM